MVPSARLLNIRKKNGTFVGAAFVRVAFGSGEEDAATRVRRHFAHIFVDIVLNHLFISQT